MNWAGYDFWWSPNSEYLAMRDRGNVIHIQSMKDLQHDPKSVAVARDGQDYYPAIKFKWSPDSQYLVISSANTKSVSSRRLYLVSSDKSKSIELEEAMPNRGKFGEVTFGLTWSPDSQYLLYTKYVGNQYNVYQFSISDWKKEKIFSISEDFPIFGFSWQP